MQGLFNFREIRTMNSFSSPFTNAQLEILKLFSKEMDEKDLYELKSLLGKFYAKKASDFADKLWEERGYTQADMDKWLHEDS